MVTKTKIIAEGDSWFALPHIPPHASNILHYFHLEATKGSKQYIIVGENQGPGGQQNFGTINGFAKYGHTSGQMVKDIGKIKKVIQNAQAIKQPIKACLFSAGGNDLIESFQKGKILKSYPGRDKYQNPKQVIYQGATKDIIKTVEKNYQIFINLCQKYQIKMIAHSYYYPAPERGGFRFLDISPKFAVLAGPWFEPEFDKKGYPKNSIRNNICKSLIVNYFVPMLEQLEKKGNGTFCFIRSHTILENFRKKSQIKNMHLDEIHLRATGCKVLAKEYKKKLIELGI